MLKGEIIAVTDADLRRTLLAFGFVLVLFVLFWKEFLLVSFDREMAITLKKRVVFWDALLFLLIGVAISMAVLSVGPLVTFGFLLIPPSIAHLFSRNMRQFAIIASLTGGVSAFVGFCLAYRWDYPVGPTDIALLGCVYGLAFLVKTLLSLRREPAAA
jgi:ABC-type Mn2+/Zn2+ transport system permease subunit